jgi:F-type H+-transporting ATPase subunit delta
MKTLADRYAAALADVAMAENSADKIRGELADFLGLLHEAPQLGTLLGSPAVPRASKRAVAEALVKRLGASHTLRNFLCVVLDHRRTRLLPEIQKALDRQLDERLGVTRAEVTSARQLPQDDQGRLQAVLQQLTGHRVEAQYKLDPELIAGTVVRIGSTIYDGSVRTRLEKLRHQLASQ